MTPTQAIKELAAYLDEQRLKFTAQRRLITEVFFERGGLDHPSVEELYQRVRGRERRVGYATVYRTLRLLCECGLASKRQFGDGHTRYEPTHTAGAHHDHLVCVDCGAIVEFENPDIERIQHEVAARYGFKLQSHKMVLYGRCGDTCDVPATREPEGATP